MGRYDENVDGLIKTLSKRGVKFGKEKDPQTEKVINTADASLISVGIDTLGKLDYLMQAQNYTVFLPESRPRMRPLRVH